MKPQWITHKGKRILYSDYSGMKSQNDMISLLNETLKMTESSPGKLLTLTNAEDCAPGPDYMKKAKEQGKKLANKLDKTAVIGVSGLKGMLLKGYNLFSGNDLKPFSTKEEALDYLVS